jgi:ABC-type amino acid transport substrate-binding protein
VYHETDSYGTKIGNGSWNGAVSLVISGVADIGVGGFTVTKERSEAVVFTDIVEFSRYAPMVKFGLCCGLGKFSLYRRDFYGFSKFIYTALCLFFTSETDLGE